MEKHGVELDLEKQINDAHPHGSSGEVDDVNLSLSLSLSLTTILVSNNGDQLFPKKVIPFSLDECRVCNADMEEDLIDLGCQCKGGLAKAHRTCIDAWFRIRGSNQCEICNQTAANVPPPTSHPTGVFKPVCLALTILFLGLLLDVLVSLALGIPLL